MTARSAAIAILLAAGACALLWPDMADFLGSRTLASLRGSGSLTRTTTSSRDLHYLPRVPAREGIRAGLESGEPTMLVEFAALTRVAGRRLDAPEGRLAVYNALRSVNRLEGLEYYSASRGERRLLYKSSYRIASPADRRRLPDPLVSVPPAHDEIWVFQEDTTFGGNVYAVGYDNEPRSVLMKIANETTLRYLLMPLVQPGAMVLYFLVVPDGEELLFYAVAAARLGSPWSRAAGAVEQSFSHRVEAMYRWFSATLAGR